MEQGHGVSIVFDVCDLHGVSVFFEVCDLHGVSIFFDLCDLLQPFNSGAGVVKLICSLVLYTSGCFSFQGSSVASMELLFR